MKSLLSILAIFLFVSVGFGQKYHPTVQAVRDTVERWHDAYQKMDAKAMSLTISDQLDSVSASGEKLTFYSRDEYQRMLDSIFKNASKKVSKIEREVDTVRFITDDVALVHASAWFYPEGSNLPQTVEMSTFVLVKKDQQWLISSHNVNSVVADGNKNKK